MMIWTFFKGLLLATLLCLIATPAWAWGIGVHLQIGSWLLSTPDALPPALVSLLQQFRNDFLYGCISADITLGKKFTHYLEHCHGWRVGEKILHAADSPARKAFAWGYLCHLAADTIAHGYFVPYKLVRTYNTALLKHAYWEMRMEAKVDSNIWPLAHEVASRSYLDNDRLLRGILSNTLFSFDTNKRLFNSLVLINRLKHWQRALSTLEKRSKWTVSDAERDDYLHQARMAAKSLLTDFAGSPYRQADPTGERAIRSARAIRRNLSTLWREGKLSEADATLYLGEIKRAFARGVTDPDSLLHLVVAEEKAHPLALRRKTRSRTA